MGLELHKVMKDGSVVHEDMSRAAWAKALSDPLVVKRWGHRPGECFDHDPLEHHLRQSGYYNRLKAEKEVVVIEPVQSVEWPPPLELRPWLLAQLAHLCIEDARMILSAPVKAAEHLERPKLANKHGQWSLFD